MHFPNILATSFKNLCDSEYKMFKLAIEGILKNKEFLTISKIHSGI